MAYAAYKFLLLGANGQVGQELQRALAPLGTVIALTRTEADLGQPEAMAQIVAGYAPDVIVNAGAYTAVDKAETESAVAAAVNCEALGVLAKVAAASGAWLVHYSTDYVFDGTKRSPYLETDATAPLNVYGRTKRDGEQAIIDSACKHLIFRTSWVYAQHGKNFLKTILNKAAQVDTLQVVSDQTGAPTGAELIADVTALCLYRLLHDPALAERASGLYHLTAGGVTSWQRYALFTIGEARKAGWEIAVADNNVLPVPATHYPTPAARPYYSVLDTGKLCDTFDLRMPSWQQGVTRVVANLPKTSLSKPN